ncbi:hypothetical protein CEXT_570851 [Caerostris extrusa]|uniref:Uncharacterized protein n=1 Tax=Caerostris extrusa TaxID=172846 RepID=A0AAV4MTW7_CAEEX|nr:hypothetical protein CEXT_570851 [Caerostris extrusa]
MDTNPTPLQPQDIHSIHDLTFSLTPICNQGLLLYPPPPLRFSHFYGRKKVKIIQGRHNRAHWKSLDRNNEASYRFAGVTLLVIFSSSSSCGSFCWKFSGFFPRRAGILVRLTLYDPNYFAVILLAEEGFRCRTMPFLFMSERERDKKEEENNIV